MADPKKGTGKKPKGSGRRLYTDENPRDTVSIKFATAKDAKNTVAKVRKVNKPYARKIQILTVMEQRAKVMGKNEVVKIAKRAKKALKDVEQKIELQMFDPKGKTKHATGGRIGFAEGVGEMLLPKAIPKEIHHDKMLQRKEQEIAQLKEEIEKRKRGKQTILDNPGAFVDKEGRFTGEALIQSADNDIAALEKELNKYLNEERVPGHATGGVSNLFRRR